MKKFTKILMVIALCFISVLGLTACNDPRVVGAYVKSGTLETTIERGEELDTSNVVLVLTYNDSTTKEVPASDLAFSAVDTSTVGEKNLVINAIKYNYSYTVKINVITPEADTYQITSMEAKLVTDFDNLRHQEKNTEETKFNNVNQDYIIAGQQNNFHFRLSATAFDGNGNRVSNIKKMRTVVKVERLVDGSFTLLTGDALNDYVEIDTAGAIFKFTEDAIGETFRISVKAANPASEDIEEAQLGFKDMKVKVVDAFNVYTAKELSVYDNARENGDTEDSFDWSAIKAEMGLTGVEVNGVVLQARINITKDDVPTEVFWSESSENFKNAANLVGKERLLGTPIDFGGRGLYKRMLADGKEFNFYGNYFTVDLKEFPKMVVQGQAKKTSDKWVVVKYKEDGKTLDDSASQMMTAHLCVFYNDKAVDSLTKTTTYNWSNIGFYGNGGLSKIPEEVYTNSGGILLMKNYAVDFNANNTLMNNFYIGYFFEKGETTNQFDGHFVVENCCGFNSYQCLFYLWGAENVKIIKSEFKNAGGPAIIADHEGNDENTGEGGYPTNLHIIDSEIESKVTGSEPWFATYNATPLAAQILSISNQLYANESKSMVVGYIDNKPLINVVVVMKSGDTEGATDSRIQGYTKITKNNKDYIALDLYKTTKNYNNLYNFADVGMGLTGNSQLAALKGNVYFQDTISGNYGDAATVMSPQGDQNCAPAGKRLSAESEYVNVYMGIGMGIVFGLSK